MSLPVSTVQYNYEKLLENSLIFQVNLSILIRGANFTLIVEFNFKLMGTFFENTNVSFSIVNNCTGSYTYSTLGANFYLF
jgi:hypothetical protein